MTYQSAPMFNKKLLAGFWLVFVTAAVLWLFDSGHSPLELASALGDFVEKSPWAPVIFIVAFAVRTLFLFPSSVFALLAGALFGGWEGSLVMVTASVVSALVAHKIGTYYPPKSFECVSKVTEHLERRGTNNFKLVLFLHLVHAPFDIVNLLAGSLGLQRKALIRSLVGTIPGFLTVVFLGASSGLSEGSLEVQPASVALSIVFLICGIALADKIEG